MSKVIQNNERFLTVKLQELRRSAEESNMVVRSLRERLREHAERKRRAKARRQFDYLFTTFINPPTDSEKLSIPGAVI